MLPSVMVSPENTSVRSISDIYAKARIVQRPVISIEFFPPKTKKGEDRLFQETLPLLSKTQPDFCSVTYGAGGNTRSKTLQVVDLIQRSYSITGLAHLTCISSTKDEIEQFLNDAVSLGIKNILALRGDVPRETSEFVPPSHGFNYAYQLINLIRKQGDFSIGAAGYPESHISCTEGKYVDWSRVKDKIDHGAQFILTQLFFDNADYFRFVDHMTNRLGVTVPITPGILPILSATQVRKFASLCGAALPANLLAKLNDLEHDDKATAEFGIDFAARQCEDLIRQGAPGLHIYSLNRAKATLGILKHLGLPQHI